MKRKKLNTNTEKCNYLNITNRKLGKLYKYSGYDFLPSDFDINPEKIKERLYLNEMQVSNIFPSFISEEKKYMKKFFKNSLKNIKKMQKKDFSDIFSHDFTQKLEIYLDMRKELTKILLKDFGSQSFDEVAIFQEIHNLNPVFGELLEEMYQPKLDEDMFEDLENKYNTLYLEKIQKLEKKQTKRRKRQKTAETELQNVESLDRKVQKIATIAKKEEKTKQSIQKIEHMKEVKTVKAQNKKTSKEKS